MLTLSGVTKAFGGQTLFEDVSLQVNRGDCIGVVGPNGSGKTTLFSLILKTETLDAGTILFQRGISVGYLPQESAPVGEQTVLTLAASSTDAVAALVHADVEARSNPLGGSPSVDGNLAAPINGELAARAKQILGGLGFRQSDFDRLCRELSGGWIMRAHLARLLVEEPDLLLLDEPTNHLDLEALLWFQEYLRSYPGALLIVSHDREFLNQLAGSIVEIQRQKLIRYKGNYDAFLAQRAAQEEQWTAAYKNQQREIARLMRFVDRFRAKNTKAAQAQSKLKQIERMEKIEAPADDEAEIDFSFPQPARSGHRVITLADVHYSYGKNVVYAGMHFQAERGQRIVLVGPNGAGKSTLLKLLAGVLPAQSGARRLGHNVRLGYYSQYRVETLHPDYTVLEEALLTPQRVTEEFVRTVLGCFLFRGDDVFKRVSVLSGGEKSRLALVKLLLDPPNLLLMDEPTTHLDMAGVEALAGALDQFEGTLIFISHDVYFIRAIANHVVHVKSGLLTHFPGDYQYYVDKTAALARRLEMVPKTVSKTPSAGPGPSTRTREQKRVAAEQRQALYRQRLQQRNLVRTLEAEIAALERRQTELTSELENPATYERSGRAQEINRELSAVVAELEERTANWEHEAAKLSALEESDRPKGNV